MAFDVWNFPFHTAGLNRWHTGDPKMRTGPGGIYQKESAESKAKYPGGSLNRWDVDLARHMGASDYQMKQLYLRAGQKGVRRDTGAGRKLLSDYGGIKSPWQFGNFGNYGMGMRDIRGMETAGWDLDQIKGAKQFATENRLNISQDANDWIDMQQDVVDNEAAWKTNLQNQMAELTDQINEPVEKPGVGYSASSVVGKGGTRAARLQTADRGSRGGTKRWKRSSWSMPTVNTGSTSGKASNNPPVNV